MLKIKTIALLILTKYRWYKSGNINIPLFSLKSFFYRSLGKKVYAYHNTKIKGFKNIKVNGQLIIGKDNVGFLDSQDRVLLNVKGQLIINGTVNISKGCRFDIGEHAICTLSDCDINGETRFIIMHNLEIGKGSIISWGCEFLDEDFHTVNYEGKKAKINGIKVGENVWIGSHTRLLKGSEIGDNSVVASGSIVTNSFFSKQKVMLAGHPARVIKTDITWER